MRRRVPFVAFAGALAGAAGVALVASVACSGYGVSRDTPDTSDGSSDAPAPPTDGSAGDDGAAAPDADAGPPPPFCLSKSPRPTFCNDFDFAKKLTDGWTYEVDYAADAASLAFALDDAVFVSPPASARVTTAACNPGFSPGIDGMLTWSGALPAGATTLHVEAKARVDGVDANAQAWLLVLRLGPDATRTDVNLVSSRQLTSVLVTNAADGGTSQTTDLAARVPYERWTELTMDVTLATGALVVGIDGATQPVPVVGPAPAPGALVVFGAGLQYYANAMLDPTDVRFDDVLLDAK